MTLLVVGNGQAVVYIGAVGRKFERVLVLGDRLLSVARAGVVVGEGEVSRSARRALLENRWQEIVWIAELRHAEIFAVAGAVVIPDIAGQSLRAINGLGKAPTDGIVTKRGQKVVVDVRRELGEVEADESVVGFVPHGRMRLSTCLHNRVRELSAAVRDNVVGGQLIVGTPPIRCVLDELLRLARQQQLEVTLGADCVEATIGEVGQDAKFVLLVADGTVSIGCGKQCRAALRRWHFLCELLHLQGQFGEGTTTALQVIEGAHVAVEIWQRGLLHHHIESPARFLVG